ncbi:hypothetical protein FPOA_12469 [Fusarium poae]|uniref:DDE-1 domain-containing protein n=1 Tax=Fusarium poae TaxID=36050 RepID=A0A1B8A959_FUSPO|nr:hypothetical protein FPOA_12469 [Fusarium poae]
MIATRVAVVRRQLDRTVNDPGLQTRVGPPKADVVRHHDGPMLLRALDWKRYNIRDKVIHWFDAINEVLEDPDVLQENVYNMDETGVMLSNPNSIKVLVTKENPHRGARVKRTTVTAIECVSGDGKHLDPMIIWPASTHRANWTTHPTPGWHYAYSDKGYTDSFLSLQWMKLVFDPQTKERANQKPRVLICDGFGTHETLEILEFCFENNIILCRLPSHTSHKLQPCDVSVFGPLKAAYRDQVEPAGPRLKKPQAVWIAPIPYEVNVDFHMHERVPQTPPTPVSAEAVTALQKLIQEDAYLLDETNKHRLQKHLQKLTNATQLSFAERALLQSHNQFLVHVNNEAKVRRSTKSEVLGTARVMSYEDLVKARQDRARKEWMKDVKKVSRVAKRAAKESKKSRVSRKARGGFIG